MVGNRRLRGKFAASSKKEEKASSDFAENAEIEKTPEAGDQFFGELPDGMLISIFQHMDCITQRRVLRRVCSPFNWILKSTDITDIIFLDHFICYDHLGGPERVDDKYENGLSMGEIVDCLPKDGKAGGIVERLIY